MGKSSDNYEHPSYKRGWRIGFIVGVILFAGSIITLAINDYRHNHDWQRIYDSDAKDNLHNIFLACKAYWADNGSDAVCTSMKIKSTLYGYIQSADVSISANGPENDFSATAQNTNSENTFRMDSNGTITP